IEKAGQKFLGIGDGCHEIPDIDYCWTALFPARDIKSMEPATSSKQPAPPSPSREVRPVLALQLQTRQAVAKRVIFEQRSGAYLMVREYRSAKNCSLQPGITRNAAVVSGDVVVRHPLQSTHQTRMVKTIVAMRSTGVEQFLRRC